MWIPVVLRDTISWLACLPPQLGARRPERGDVEFPTPYDLKSQLMRCRRSQSHLISTRRPTAAPLRLSLFPSFLANPPDRKQLSPPPISFFHLSPQRNCPSFPSLDQGEQAMAGARSTPPSPLLPIPMLLLLWLVSINLGGNVLLCEAQKTWCVAKPSTEEATLQQNIDFACSQVDCSAALQGSGSPCSNPGTRINHASVAMNLYYQSKGRNFWNCHFKASGLIVQTDPSYGNCVYM